MNAFIKEWPQSPLMLTLRIPFKFNLIHVSMYEHEEIARMNQLPVRNKQPKDQNDN